MERKRKTIISKLKSKHCQRTHKYRIRIPKSVKEGYAFDKDNSNKLWTEGINIEMNKVIISEKESNVSSENFIGYQEIGLHIIFYINLGEKF